MKAIYGVVGRIWTCTSRILQALAGVRSGVGDARRKFKRLINIDETQAEGRSIRLVNYLRRYLQKWNSRKTWWVCEYSIIGNGRSESGAFAEFGATHSEATRNAFAYIQRNAWINGNCDVIVRRPTLHEALFGSR